MNQTNTQVPPNNKLFLTIIVILSIVVPLLVSVLMFLPQSGKLGDFDVSFLPHFNAVLNSGTSLALILGFYFIKNKQIQYHRFCMISAFTLSSIFLLSYVLYHYQAASVKFGGEGLIRSIYFFFLLTHIVLAAIIVPFVLMTIYYAISNQIEKHKKLARWTFPMWLYVATTGVIVYVMISPYYV